jgi:endoglucanase
MRSLAVLGTLVWSTSAMAAGWPHLERFVATFVTAEGRVREPSAGNRTTSEGQAYGLFFALVANDRPLFDRLLAWTDENLAHRDLGHSLPAWEWGEDKQHHWSVLDKTSAADADLWMAYTLLEAGRLWSAPDYARTGRALLDSIARTEVADLRGLGKMLLTGSAGSPLGKDRWRLNPSYVPIQLARRLSTLDPDGPWAAFPPALVRMVGETAPRGLVPDWVVWDGEAARFAPDPATGTTGSYDAVRVYLWAAMLDPAEPERQPLLDATGGLLEAAKKKTLREKADVTTGVFTGFPAPPAYTATVLVNARAAGKTALASAAAAKLDRELDGGLYLLPDDQPRYYDQVLTLFARGFAESRFHFGADGALEPAWEQ